MDYNDIYGPIAVPYVKEVSPRLYLREEISHAIGDPITTPENVMDLVRRLMRDLSEEVILVVSLDSRNQPICVCKASTGTIDRAICTPRDVLKSCILANATSFVLAHNHPSGDQHPSQNDLALTRKFIRAGVLMDLYCLDHIIIGGINGRCYSLLLHEKEMFNDVRDKARAEFNG